MDKGGSSNKCSGNDKMDSPKENSTKAKTKVRGKKRKRQDSGSSEYEEMLSENALEMEKNLHASAVKNNLDETSVRKILKKVVTNDHVLALVKLREEEEDSGPEENSLRPKLTRAKVKELMKVSPKAAAWNLENLELTPIKHIPVKTRPEVKALIAQELPEDEDDEEYEPTHEDVPSDDEQGLESCSDLESQPRTPATPHSVHTASPRVVKDGPFKVPQEISTPTRRKLNLEEEATIALRTRSKLSLSSTSIEHIESTFVPPDEPPMPAVDDLWNQFLNECLNPASSSKHEDDDETDPEYNVAADPDANDEDEEALGNSIIKISKKELNDLVTELFNIMPEAHDDQLPPDNLANSVLTDTSQAEISSRWEGKQEPVSDEEGRQSKFADRITFEKRGYSRTSIGKSEPPDTEGQDTPQRDRRRTRSKSRERRAIINKPARSVDIAIEEREAEEAESSPARRLLPPPLLQRHLRQAKTAQCVTIKVNQGVTILPEQTAILQQQLRQHIQLATSSYLQLYTHPVHWAMAPPYKEYLESLSKLCASNPVSVARVCNLQPALELLRTWEDTVSANTPENKEMVEFIQKESEKCRRRFSHKSQYVGEFHSTLQQVVANSPVFVYPHLLPPRPFRADTTHRRAAYTRSEDELIVLGLDQFWDYVDANPGLFKPRQVWHRRHRWGLTVTLDLVAKYMFPWMPLKVLLGHVQFVRKSGDKDNPINKFFAQRTVTPVQHKLLPYNPRLTLYEQPEHELPKIWVRYLARTSQRFKNYLLKRSSKTSIEPEGVEVRLGEKIVEPTKAPLPIDFTKEIVSNRINLRPKEPKPVFADKFDIQIANTPTSSVAVVTNLFRLVETSTGAYLMPLSNTNTVDSNNSPISTPAEFNSKVLVNNVPESSNTVPTTLENQELPVGDKNHCSCCILLRKICKTRQSTIKEFFCRNKTKKCYCSDIKYPKISNRLRLLVRNFKSNSLNALQYMDAVLRRKTGKQDEENDKMEDSEFNLDDFVFASSFHLKLLTQTTAARDTLLKRRVHMLISRFNPHLHDPIELAKSLYKACSVELIDLYKEFLCFLTPEQADKCDGFRDYFRRNCAENLFKKIETDIPCATTRSKVVRKLRGMFNNNLLAPCDMCSDLLTTLEDHPNLARHVFSLFPHTKENRPAAQSPPTVAARAPSSDQPLQHAAPEQLTADRTDANVDYEADHSSSEDDEEDNNNTDAAAPDNSCQPAVIKNEITVSENETEIEHMNHSIVISNVRHESSDSSNDSMTIDEDSIKPEPAEWKRDQDKLILEVLKQHLTPEQRKDKTITEIIEEKDIINMIAASLTDKSKTDVTNRVLYLLQLLVLSEN